MIYLYDRTYYSRDYNSYTIKSVLERTISKLYFPTDQSHAKSDVLETFVIMSSIPENNFLFSYI